MTAQHDTSSSTSNATSDASAEHRSSDPVSEDARQPEHDLYERELAAEQAHVDLVYARLAEATRNARKIATDGQARYRSDRQTFLREEDGSAMLERDVFAFQAAKRLATLDAEHEGLVFGRLDRIDTEVRYIGRIGVRDEDYEPLVIDWRAPAAEPFYRATPAEPMQIRRRRVLRSRGVKVVGIEDDLLDSEHGDQTLAIIGEGALLAALSRARGHQMRDIVATIQAEQDEAIRAPYQGVTLISGGPGTGKTVVALHRAAFLLYSHRRRLEAGGVLVVGPSLVFMNYIERVLPSLGEESVTLRPIGLVAADVVPRLGKTGGEAVDTAEVASIKGRAAMAKVMRRLAVEPPAGGPVELRVLVKGEILVLRAERLDRIRREVLSHAKLNRGRAAAETALLNALWSSRPAEVDIDREEFDDLVTDLASYKMFVLGWWPSVEPLDALRRLGDPALAARLVGSTLRPNETEALSASFRGSPRVTVADSALLDELADHLGPVPVVEQDEPDLFLDGDVEVRELVTTADRLSRQREVDPFAEPYATYAHILIDEAQDITPMQWRMLRRRGPSASWTIVGDPAQSSWPEAAESRAALEQTIGNAPLREFRMSTNYRSPAEVFDLAAKVITGVFPDADLPTAVRSTGIEPDLRVARDGDVVAAALSAVEELFDLVEGTVGLIVAPTSLADLRAATGSLPPEQQARLAVVTPLEAKGLEYDAVVVVEPDRIVDESPGGARVLYVALTRPTQRLVTLDAAPDAAWRKFLG